ncbi:MAG: hypothetical protein IPL40_13695 [Proteobacteria bacterium]|nr:hypothetical protein [Pseudomonadota bacterium]
MTLTPDTLLERSQWDFFWAPSDALVVDRPELLYIRSPRDLPHLNTVARLRAKLDRVPALLEEVMKAHAGRRSRCLVSSRQARPGLEAQLRRAGYQPGHEHGACSIAPERYTPRPLDEGLVVERVGSIQQLRDSAEVSRRAFGAAERDEVGDANDAQLECDLACLTGPMARISRFVAYDSASGQPLSTGGLNVYPALRFGFLWGGGTAPEARGRGAYTAIVARRLALARQLGLRLVGLYARLDGSAPIVAKQGFARHGAMVFWERRAQP